MNEPSSLAAHNSEQDSYTITKENPAHKTPLWLRFIVVALILLLLGVIFLLPRVVEPNDVNIRQEGHSTSEENNLAAAADPAAEQDSLLAEAAKLQFRRDTQNVLANIIKLKTKLNEKLVQQWAAEDFSEIELKLLSAEQSYQRGNYEISLTEFSLVEKSLVALDARYEPLLESHLAAGDDLFEAGSAEAASSSYQQALLMDPDSDRATKGLRRAQSLPKVLENLEQAREYFQNSEFSQSIKQAELALAIDAEYRPAISQKLQATEAYREQRFQAAMSLGFNQLEQRQWQQARAAFNEAKQTNIERTEPTEALEQLESRLEQEKVKLELDRARQLENQEQWQESLLVYDKLLKRDPGLVDPAARRVKVRVRAAIDTQIESYLSDPLQLSDDRVYKKSQQLLANTRSLAQPGSRLQAQLEQLQAVLKRMAQEYTVEFISDGLTDVSLYRVSSLGKFIRKEYTLKPGNYVVAGGRPGYRDVRIEFTLTGLDEAQKIHVQCTESI